jgi:Fe-S cluster biogenesis protein NfuA
MFALINNNCKKTTQTVAVGRQQVQWTGVCPGCLALFVTTDRQIDRQTDTTVVFIYKMWP